MKTKSLTFAIVAALLVVSVAAVSEFQIAEAKKDANGKPDLVATLTGVTDSNAKGKAMFWFDDDSNPTSITYQIVLNKIDVNGNPGKGLDELLTKVHIHYAPLTVHQGMHLYNILGPADDLDDGKIAGNTLSGVWDAADIVVLPPTHHSSKPLTAMNPNGNTILKNLCTENTDVNIHTDVYPTAGAIRGIIEANTDACANLGF